MVVKFYCDDGEIFRRQLPEPAAQAAKEDTQLDVGSVGLSNIEGNGAQMGTLKADMSNFLAKFRFADPALGLQSAGQPLRRSLNS